MAARRSLSAACERLACLPGLCVFLLEYGEYVGDAAAAADLRDLRSKDDGSDGMSRDRRVTSGMVVSVPGSDLTLLA